MSSELQVKIKKNDLSYQIKIGRLDLISELSTLLKDKSKSILITDPRLYDLYGQDLSKNLKLPLQTYLLPEGESSKSWQQAAQALTFMLDRHYDRNSCLLALGGGVVGDFGGFVSAVYQRGIDFIQIPSSLLAMTDSSVGGKTAVNLAGIGKNMVGAFHQPLSVLINLSFLETLPQAEWKNGLAEILKYAFIREDEGAFYDWLHTNCTKIINKDDPQILQEMIFQSIKAKAQIVAEDETEKTGKRALLNLGHTFGHALEAESSYQIPHGQAVSIGIALAAKMSLKLGMICESVYRDILQLLTEFTLPHKIPSEFDFAANKLATHCLHDKKAKNGKVQLILPSEVMSYCVIRKDVDLKLIESVFAEG